MKGIKKISMKSYDTKWAKLVRDRDGCCKYCGQTTYLAAHHIFGRARNGTRLVLDNGITLCPSHHTFNDTFSAHKTPEKFKRWIKRYLGLELYKFLEKKSLGSNSRAQALKEFNQLYESYQN